MPADVWSWGIALTSITGMILTGMHFKSGWLVLLGLQGIWVAYGFHKGEEGFFLMAGASSVIYVFNWWRWRRKEKNDQSNSERDSHTCDCRPGPGVQPELQG